MSVELSVVIPVYGCRAALPELHKRLCEAIEKITQSYEIILVDDHCPQNSWEEIIKICNLDHHVIGIHLSRNFGQLRAITAGLDKSRGNWVVVMDCDLQDRPESIQELWKKAQEGFDVVFARREERKDSILISLLSEMFYKVYDYFTDGVFDNSICNFSISKRCVIDNYCRMREQNRAYTMFIRWLGFRQTSINLLADERYEGKSSYSFNKKLKLASEIITAQSNKPLLFSIKIGFIVALLAFIYICYLFVRTILFDDILSGWTTIVASIYLIGGILLCAIGVVGMYIGNIFNEVKGRPLYIISDCLNGVDES